MLIPSILFAFFYLIACIMLAIKGRHDEFKIPERVVYCVLMAYGFLMNSVLAYLLYNIPS
jgi:multidrug transporter EmrE-like cation transporter